MAGLNAMTYSIKEIFFTLQGEGAHSGRAAIFLRFAGCNLWTGREEDRYKAICQFCDTDFVGTDGENGGKYETAEMVANLVDKIWCDHTENQNRKYIVCTGGEPLLQIDAPFIDALHQKGFTIAIESNGTIKAPIGIDWICISPKKGAPILQTSGSELKFVYPQEGFEPQQFESLDFQNFFIQPMDNENYEENLIKCVVFCQTNPKWSLSLQTHKIINIP